MSYVKWLDALNSAEKVSMLSGNNRKVLYKFTDGQQMAEEYSMETGVLQRRAWRKCKQLLGEPQWETELGETPSPMLGTGSAAAANSLFDSDITVLECNDMPILSKRMTKKNIEWRIRNLPYPIEVYQVRADETKRAIVVSTTNRKYYKVIGVPDLERCSLLPKQANITVHHQFNTLIITYKKPDLLLELEAQVLLLLKSVPTETAMDDLLKGLLAK